jgi:uncharacterized protein (TIGR00369 family)
MGRHKTKKEEMTIMGRLNQAGRFSQKLFKLKEIHHKKCVFSGSYDPLGKDLKVNFDDDGTLVAEFFCHERYQGFDGMLHGGISAALLDAVMTKCLMGHGIVAYTARLQVRYLKPVKLGRSISIQCGIEHARLGKLYELSAIISQGRVVHACAHASFYRID